MFVDECLQDGEIAIAANYTPLDPFPTISLELVLSSFSKLKNSTRSDPDGIPSIVLKKCSAILSTPVTALFNISLRSGIFPNAWKKSFVFPVHKKGCKRNIKNYRGIAELCSIGKLLPSTAVTTLRKNNMDLLQNAQPVLI